MPRCSPSLQQPAETPQEYERVPPEIPTPACARKCAATPESAAKVEKAVAASSSAPGDSKRAGEDFCARTPETVASSAQDIRAAAAPPATSPRRSSHPATAAPEYSLPQPRPESPD